MNSSTRSYTESPEMASSNKSAFAYSTDFNHSVELSCVSGAA